MEHYLTRLENTIKNYWDKPALCNYKGEQFTYGELAATMAKFHIFFEKIGIKKGDRITLCAPNSARWAVSFLTINTYEAVVVPLLNEFLPDSISHLTDHSDSVLLFTDRETWSKMKEEDTPKLRAVINCADFTLLYAKEDAVREAMDSMAQDFEAKYPDGFGRADVKLPVDNEKDLAVINYTSGTTSAPKGVMLRYECFSATTRFGVDSIPVDARDSIVSMLPMGHIYGLAFEFLYPMINGAAIYYLGKTPSPTLLLKAMKEVRPYLVVTVPLVMEKVYKSSILPAISKWYMKVLLHIPGINCTIYKKIGAKLQEAFGGKVRMFIMGGAALNPDVEKCFKRIKLPYTVGYGMTEAAPLMAYEDYSRYVAGSCGKPIAPYVTVRIDSEDPQHIPGEIQAKGTNICSGYYNNPEATRLAFTEDGFLKTGDLGTMDADGNIFIKGRSKSMILSASGQNIYPEEVEAIINSQDYVAESLVVDRAGKVVALVYLDSDAIRRNNLDKETISDIPENIRIASNRLLPAYSKITKVEIMTTPFAKTPKMSIKRFMYQ